MVCIGFTQTIVAQDYCGTTEDTEFFKAYHANKERYQVHQRSPEDLVFIPMTVHIVQNDDGNNGYSTTALQGTLCSLNEQFLPSNMQFYMKGKINYIDNSILNNAEDFNIDFSLFTSQKVNNTINVFFVSDASGNCGYFSRGPDIVVIRKSCSGAGSTVWTHELGHYFSLPHPFRGWEGMDVRDATEITDVVTINGRSVLPEKIDKSNCTTTGDRICDTDPDYLSFRWTCNADSLGIELTDPDGIEFRPDGQLYMSYSNDPCQSRFSSDQMDQMLANLNFNRQDLLADPQVFEYNDPIIASYPISADTISIDQVDLSWEEVPQAETYEVEIAINRSFTIQRKQYETSNSELYIPAEDLRERRHYWRVRPVNSFDQCAAWSDAFEFHPRTLTSIEDLSFVNSFNLYPSINIQDNLNVQINLASSYNASFMIMNVNGQIVKEEAIILNAGNNVLQFNIPAISSGLYYAGLRINGNNLLRKVIIK
jgi:hypothetical protein